MLFSPPYVFKKYTSADIDIDPDLLEVLAENL
jgi:hypothetical protein